MIVWERPSAMIKGVLIVAASVILVPLGIIFLILPELVWKQLKLMIENKPACHSGDASCECEICGKEEK
uniref:Uncharacterized protein n=1 Tax=viral metagenome TaxID=1070528 RepID=A0A6M3X9D7_9ZZZZ